MINGILNISPINKVQYSKTTLPFRGACTIDVFEKSEKAKGIKVEQDRYEQINDSIEISQVASGLKKTSIAFPAIVRGVIGLVPTYLEQKISTDSFVDVFQKRTPVLYHRLEFGKDKEEFANDFDAETKFIKKLDSACELYRNKELALSELNSIIEEEAACYLENSAPKDTYYLD